jgi:hypothetical protein
VEEVSDERVRFEMSTMAAIQVGLFFVKLNEDLLLFPSV